MTQFDGRGFIEKLRRDYSIMRPVIEGRLEEFRRVDRSDAGRLFEELAFCILTPQSSAKRADAAVKELSRSGLLLNGKASDVYSVLRQWGVRFPAAKARYIILDRRVLMGGERLKQLLSQDGRETRDKLVKVVWGFGYKEASHFLRNIGYKGLAIIDRHVIRGLVRIGVLRREVNLSSRRRYLMVEERFIEAAEIVGVQPEALDLLLWFEGTGEVFK
ncbi:MAG: N-glycosylase/DNA lyase [Nitrososphaerota archaeon]|nr:N-glycosylase/DNA lyase [Candidatus Calditenuaceae archaeon]MDW8072673.1 N-glycosylase/DNA lyase [Nitrososphaerota archaeon]